LILWESGQCRIQQNLVTIGVDTFGHILEKMGSLEIPNLRKSGNAESSSGQEKVAGVENPKGRYTHLGEASNGKDTMTGHWEMMGIKTEKPFKTIYRNRIPAGTDRRTGEKMLEKRVIGKQERKRNGDY